MNVQECLLILVGRVFLAKNLTGTRATHAGRSHTLRNYFILPQPDVVSVIAAVG